MSDKNISQQAGALTPSKGAPGQQTDPAAGDSTCGAAPAPPAGGAVCALSLRFDDSSGLVYGRLTRVDKAPALTLFAVRERLSAEGFGAFYAPDDTLASVVAQANEGQEGEWVLAERKEAKATWQISPDRQAVTLTLTPAWGGEALTPEHLLQGLEAQGVVRECVLPEALREAAEKGDVSEYTVARAKPPQKGQDTRFEALVARDENLALTEDEQGRVNMHHLHDFVVVEPGTPLLRRIPATQGEPGLDVCGGAIEAPAGRDQRFDTPGKGAERSASDPDLLVAAIRGHPVFTARGVRVDAMLRLKSVGVSSGDVEFDGSVEVAGDVGSGFSVRVSGDILIRGMVESADIQAGGNITVLGGVAGEEVAGEKGAEGLKVRLRAKRDIRAKFVNLGALKAGRDVHVSEYILQSQVAVGRDVVVGQPAGRGAIMGGRTIANRRVVLNRLGSEAGVVTDVRVGFIDHKRRLRETLRNAQALCEQNLNKLDTMLERTPQDAPSASEATQQRLVHTRTALQQRRQRLIQLRERLALRHRDRAAAHIHIRQHQYGNTLLTIDGVLRRFVTEQGAGRWQRHGAELVRQA